MNKLMGTTVAIAIVVAMPAVVQAKPSSVDKSNAARQCKAELEAAGLANFRELYGTNKNRKNAMGKCVSRHAKAQEKRRERAERNAAKECKAERDADPAAFEQKYGSNQNRGNHIGQEDKANGKRNNALGKCISQRARQLKEEFDTQDSNRINAAKLCKAEREQDPQAFTQKYGTNKNKRNAFGKCVSAIAKRS